MSGSSIPEHVSRPSYYLSGQPGPGPSQPQPNTPQEVERMRAACSLASKILSEASTLARPGVTTDHIDQTVTKLAFQASAYPSPLNYRSELLQPPARLQYQLVIIIIISR